MSSIPTAEGDDLLRSAVSPESSDGRLRRVAVVILNWRAAEMTISAVERVLLQTVVPDTIYVVDNGSDDGSDARFARAFPPEQTRVQLLFNGENKGFGGGCNTALNAVLAADYDYVWLLNNDAEPDRACLSALLESAESAAQPVGIVGSLLHDPAGHCAPHFGSWVDPLTLMCGSVESAIDLVRHRHAWLTAASMLVAVDALRAVGTFDETFFMYWEDADLNARIQNAGFNLVAAPGARVAHSAGTSSAQIPVQRYLWHFASQRHWISKHHPHPSVANAWLRAKFLIKALLDADVRRFRALLTA